MSRSFDVVIIGDLRFPGGTSTAVAAEIDAQARAGYRTGVISLKGPVLKYPHPIHPQIRTALETGRAELLDPDSTVEAGLVLLHHPQVVTHLPASQLRIRAEHRLLVAHHPPFDADGKAFYDWQRIDQNAAALLGASVPWAPVGPMVREQLMDLELAAVPWARDWHNVLDPTVWSVSRDSQCKPRLVVGRHSRPDPLKWPATREEALLVYPSGDEFLVRILGSDPGIARFLSPTPPNWELLPFGAMEVPRFLAGLDAYAFYHHPRWVEAFGRTVIEAMASSLAVLLPPHFEPLFGDAARYAETAEASTALREWLEDPPARREQAERGLAAVRSRFSLECHAQRVRELIGPPRARPRPTRARSRVALFFTSNGVGLGHVTRAMAIARRCEPGIEPVFVTLSQAATLIEEAGYTVEYLPFHAYLGADVNRWNQHLAVELGEMVRFYDPRVIAFDGNTPYSGLIKAMQGSERAWSVWIRRGFWRTGTGTAALEREIAFDAVIEPEDLAEVVDRGPTTKQRSRTVRVAPIRLLDEAELLPRDAARRALDLPIEGFCVLIQLGAGNNYDFTAIQERILTRLELIENCSVALLDSPIAHGPVPQDTGLCILRQFPSSRYLHAFDCVISAVGYNSFHELVLSGTPSLFVPNEHPMMDDQRARAEHAERMGWGLSIRTGEIYRLGEKLDRLLDPDERLAMRRATADLPRRNGADQAARVLAEMSLTARADRAR